MSIRGFRRLGAAALPSDGLLVAEPTQKGLKVTWVTHTHVKENSKSSWKPEWKDKLISMPRKFLTSMDSFCNIQETSTSSWKLRIMILFKYFLHSVFLKML